MAQRLPRQGEHTLSLDLLFSAKHKWHKGASGTTFSVDMRGRVGLPGSLVLERDVPQQRGCPSRGRQGQAVPSPPHLLACSPFCGFSAWVDSPVVWALPVSATESGFLLGAKPAPLFSALTTWTNPTLINHLCSSHLSCSICIFCFSGGYCDPWADRADPVLCCKASP